MRPKPHPCANARGRGERTAKTQITKISLAASQDVLTVGAADLMVPAAWWSQVPLFSRALKSRNWSRWTGGFLAAGLAATWVAS